MNPDCSYTLQTQPPERLADALLTTSQESIKRFKNALAGIKRNRRFIRWGESATFARQLGSLLDELRTGVSDPRTGAELVAAFYECDKGTLGTCDDSSGHVGDLFRYDARELFVEYASRCDDKEWLGELVFKVNRVDDYGVRDTLINVAAHYLTEPVMRSLVAQFRKLADKQSDEYAKRHWLTLVETLARQLKDAPLFEQTRIDSWGELSIPAYLDIARVYLECNDAQTALFWLKKVSSAGSHWAGERDDLLLEVYGRLGDISRQGEVAWRLFRYCRTLGSLGRLLAVIGEEQRDAVLAGEAAVILGSDSFSVVDAGFLIAVERHEAAEAFLLKHAGLLNGDNYAGLLPLADAMMDSGRFLCASLIYRALLDSILSRAQSRIYHHGIRYLRKLDRLAASIGDWRNFEPHASYKTALQQQHGRKTSFWPRYSE